MSEREYASIYLRADQMHNFYKREEYDLLSYFGDLGGLAGIVSWFGWVISASIVERMFQAALVEQTYRWQKYDIDDTQYYETRIAGQVTSENSSNDDEEKKKEQEANKKEEVKVASSPNQKVEAKAAFKHRTESAIPQVNSHQEHQMLTVKKNVNNKRNTTAVLMSSFLKIRPD